MAISITIDGNERKDKVEFGSLNIQSIITRKRDKCSFVIVENTGDTYKPKNGEEVVITDSGTKIFGGVITVINSRPSAYGMIHHHIQCQDYTRLLDRKLVPDTFEDQTVDQIITSLKDSYFPNEITINNVDAPLTIDYIAFNYKPIVKCLEELADLIGYDFYIDYDKNLHFQAKTTTDAPFDITDTGGTYEYNSLTVRRDNTQLRNTIVVRGGEYLGETRTVEFEANGTDFIFPTQHKFSNFSASLTGNALNLGIFGIDDANAYDALHDFNQKILVFKNDDRPSTGATGKMIGNPNLPVIVKYKAQDAIASTRSAELGSGDYEYLVVDKSINSKAGARQRAEAEVLAYSETLSEAEFITETSGLTSGMRILINSTSRGINEYFIINKVTTRQRNDSTFSYEVSLITTKTHDIIDILQNLILESTKKIIISKDEIIDLVEGFPAETITLSEVLATSTEHNLQTETITLSETFTAQSLNFETVFVAGAQTPTGFKRVFITNGSRLG